MSSKDALNLPIGSVFQKKWIVVSKLGQGGFGAVYKVEDATKKDKFYALKIERTNIANSVLKMDTIVLLKLRGKKHVCNFQACGRDDKINYLVMSLAGSSLEGLFDKAPNHRFSLSTVLQLGLQSVDGLKDLHDGGFLHRDVKPANFALGRGHESRVIKILDFGLARQYLNKDGGVRPARKSLGFRGTERYASINAHHGVELGRGDDLISMFYMLVEFVQGRLPWSENDDFETVGERKESAPNTEWSKVLPRRLAHVYEKLLKLKYESVPDYAWINDQFKQLGRENKLTLNEPFDWEAEPKKKSPSREKQSSPRDYPYERQFQAEKSVRGKNPDEDDA